MTVQVFCDNPESVTPSSMPHDCTLLVLSVEKNIKREWWWHSGTEKWEHNDYVLRPVTGALR